MSRLPVGALCKLAHSINQTSALFKRADSMPPVGAVTNRAYRLVTVARGPVPRRVVCLKQDFQD